MFKLARTRHQSVDAETGDASQRAAGRRLVRRRSREVGVVLGLSFVLVASAAVALGVSSSSTRRPSPSTGLMPNGRQLAPVGTRVTLGNLPTGAAMTADGRYLWTVSAGIGYNDVRIVDTAQHRVCQILPVPGASGGIALDSVHHLAYVSGLSASLWLPTQFTYPFHAAYGNDVLVFSWTAGACGHARLLRVIKVPPQPSAPAPLVFPPKPTGKRLVLAGEACRLG